MHFSFIAVVAGLAGSALAVSVPDGAVGSSYETYQAFRRSLKETALLGRDTTFENKTSIAKSFHGATLYSGAIDYGAVSTSLDIVCTTCYVTADITAELRVFDKFNVSAGIDDIITNIETDIKNITNNIIDSIEEAAKNNVEDVLALQFDDMEWPTIDLDLSLDTLVDDLPDVEFVVKLDNFDFYVELATTLTDQATLSLNLFTSQSAFGVRINKDTQVGVSITVDLIISASAGVTIDHGFHLSIEDDLSFIIDLFSSNVSTFVFNGGAFEFLPITVNKDVELNTVLRVGLHAGVALSSGSIANSDALTYGSGIDGVIFVDVANLTTVVKASALSTGDENTGVKAGCDGDFAAANVFAFGVGAGVGASVELGNIYSWGIGPTVQTPVYYTTIAACPSGTPASNSSPAAVSATATTTPAVARRDTFETTLSTSVTYAAVGCKSIGLMNCPVSLQTTTIMSTEITTVLTFDSSLSTDATWPASILTTDIPTKKFGDAASSMLLSASGVPTLYTPPSPTSTGTDGEPTPGTPGTTTVIGHTITNKTRNVIIGVTVGVGVPLVALIVFGCVACIKKRKGKAAVIKYDSVVTEETLVYGK